MVSVRSIEPGFPFAFNQGVIRVVVPQLVKGHFPLSDPLSCSLDSLCFFKCYAANRNLRESTALKLRCNTLDALEAGTGSERYGGLRSVTKF